MMSYAVLVIVKATLVCGAAFVVAYACRRARASVRHLLFACAFAALIAIPAAAPIVPALTVMLPAPTASLMDAQPAADVLVPPNVVPRNGTARAPAIAEVAPAEWPLTIPQALAVLWLIGVAISLVPMVAGVWQVRRLRRTAIPWTDGQDTMQSLVSTRGLRRKVDVVVHDAVAGPLTCGVLRPSIILPVTARDWDDTALRRTFTHELDHVARWDLLTNCVSRVICAAYWFHPLVWAAWRRLRLEAEKACDDAVVYDDDARDYALLLVSMAQPAAAGRPPTVAMASRDDLTARVAALLDERQTRGRVGQRRAAVFLAAGATATLIVASITVARAMPQAQVTVAVPAPGFAAASIKRYGPQQNRMVNGRMIANYSTARDLLFLAFGVFDVEGGPWWLNYYRFDIVANMPMDQRGPGQGSEALRAFMAERFKLVAHVGSKDRPVYALVQVRPGGSLGPQMTPSQRDCRSGSDCGLSSRDGLLTGRGITLAELARHLREHVGFRQLFDRDLVDRTGLSGRFDFTLEWPPDAVVGSTAATPAPSQNRPFVSMLALAAPNFLKALEEQLGLRLESQLAPGPVLVIERIEEPVEN